MTGAELRDATLLVAVRGSGVALQFLAIVAVAWALHEADAGVYFFAYGSAQLAAAVARLGLDQALVRNVPSWRHHGEAATVRGALVWASLIGSVAACVVAIATAHLVPPDIRSHVVLVVVSMVLSSVWLGALQGLGRSRAFATLRDVAQPGTFVAGLLLVSHDAASALVLLTASYVVTLAWTAALVAKDVGIGPVANPGASALSDALSMWPPGLLAHGSRWADTLVLGLLVGPVFLATFTPLSRAAALVWFPLTVLNVSFPPRIALLHRLRRHDGMQALSRAATALSVLTSGALVVVLVPYLSHVVPWIVPHASDPAVPLAFGILLIGSLLSAATGPSGYTLTMTGLARVESLALASGLAAYLVVAVATVPSYGIVAAAVAYAGMHGVTNGLRLKAITSRLRLNTTGRHHVVAFAAVAGILVASVGLPPAPLIALQIVALAAIARELVTVVRAHLRAPRVAPAGPR